MYLLVILGMLAAVVVGLLAVLLLVCVGPWRLRHPLRYPDACRDRLREIGPYIGGLALTLVVNKGLHKYSVETSWIIDANLTGIIYTLEGDFVAQLQQSLPYRATLYFSFIYVFGYVVLLVFPMIAYFFLDSLHDLKMVFTAYAVNYAGGVLCYTLFVTYGPRNIMPNAVDQPMYELFPQVMLLTSSVNTNTNVFPSLHTSLAVTAMIFALMTKEEYPRWSPVAVVVGTSVVVSTMYLGIHWLTDVVAGVALGALSVYAAAYLVERAERSSYEFMQPRPSSVRWSESESD